MLVRTIAVTLAVFLASTAFAGSNADALGRCLADNTTGKERKALARWIFVAMSAHPEMRGLSAVTEADVEQASRSTAAIFTKLLSETCATEARDASAKEGSQSLQIAFGMLGELAMQEVASDRNVATVMSNFERYVDQAKVQAAIGVK